MKKIIYTCDFCGKTIEDDNLLAQTDLFGGLFGDPKTIQKYNEADVVTLTITHSVGDTSTTFHLCHSCAEAVAQLCDDLEKKIAEEKKENK